jgi:alpha-galactosidase
MFIFSKGAWIAAGAIGLVSASLATAQTATSTYDPSNGIVRLDGGNVTYALGVTKQGLLVTVYWGGRLRSSDT